MSVRIVHGRYAGVVVVVVHGHGAARTLSLDQVIFGLGPCTETLLLSHDEPCEGPKRHYRRGKKKTCFWSWKSKDEYYFCGHWPRRERKGAVK